MPLHWALTELGLLYDSIQARDNQQLDILVKELSEDLKDLNSTYPHKNDSSRNKLESGKIKLSSNEEYEVNKDFIVTAIQLSDDLNLDELVSAELIFHASSSHDMGTSVVDSAKAIFYLRRQNILSIVSYILNASDNLSHVDIVSSLDNLLKSFQVVEDELQEVKNLIKRSKLLGVYHSIHLQQNIKFRRDFLYKEHELLSEVLLGLVKRRKLSTDHFIKIFKLLDKYDPDDLFMVHYLPGVFLFCAQIDMLGDSEIKALYNILIKQELADVESISGKPMKLAIILVFITFFTHWCNAEPSRSREYEFESSCSTPMSSSIDLGAMEQLLCVAADMTVFDASMELNQPFYDYRSLLQKHLPKLFPKQILDIDEEATLQYRRKLQQENAISHFDDDSVPPIYSQDKEFRLSSHFISLFIPLFTQFVETFITSSVFMLTKLRDSEEDSYLSSETFNLDELSTNAELERFYLMVYYLYSSRPNLASRFWDKTSPLYGFVKWSSSCSSALMRSTFCLMLSAFASGERNAIETYNFLQSNSSMGPTSSTFHETSSTLNWSSIYEDLIYYNKALSEPSADENQQQLALFSSLASRTQASTPGRPELGEDSILFITGYFQVISQVAYNNDETKKELFESDEMELPNILKSFLSNDSSLTGPCLSTLRSLISDDVVIKNKIWEIVENWIFKASKSRQYISKDGSKLNSKKIFSQSLVSLDHVIEFNGLLHKLFSPVRHNGVKQLSLQFPLDLGLGNGRKQGIYPYFEFLLEEVFASSVKSYLSLDEKLKLQKQILSIVLNSLNSIEETSLTTYSQHCHLTKLDNLFSQPLNFKAFVEADSSSAVMSSLFDEKVYTALFEVLSIGADEIAGKPAGSSTIQNLSLGLKIVDRILALQKYFIETAIPIIKDSNNPTYVPANFGTHGLRSFYDAILFKLPLVAHLALYVGSEHLGIAKTSLQILDKIGESSRFNENANRTSSKTILLTTFETIDETERIKNAFIDQLSSEITSDINLTVKLKILKFLDRNLSSTKRESTVAHFLLGFESKGYNNLIAGSLASERSLFKTLLYILISSIDSLQAGQNIRHAPIKLAAIAMEVILKLCKNPISKHIVLPLLRNNADFNLFSKLLSSDVNLDSSSTFFEGLQFDDVLSHGNKFTTESQGIGALTSFIQFRTFVCQYLAIELSGISETGSLSLKNSYIKSLTSGDEILNGSPKILGFSDILEFNFVKMVEPFELKLLGDLDYEFILKSVKLKDYDFLNSETPIYDLTVLHKCVDLVSIEYCVSRVSERNSLLESINREQLNIEKYLINYTAFNDFKTAQLNCLNSWTYLIQTIITQGGLDAPSKSRIILEVFQCVLPKINDYIELDISFAEELASACVLLYDQYGKDNSEASSHNLFPVFQTCIYGLIAAQSTSSIRSDFYVLANKYLKQIEYSKELVGELFRSLELDKNENLLKTIFNDSILGESSARVTSLLLLETLVKLCSHYDKAMLPNLIKNDYLSLLVRSIKRTDDLLASTSKADETSSTTLSSLLYELTAFKTTLYFLVRVAETRVGAYKLIQSDIFNIIKNSVILKIDPDLGVDLKFDELNREQQKAVLVNLSLDTPLRLPHEYHEADKSDKSTTISLFEILVPIFQLLNAVVISMGPSNKPVITKTKELLTKVEKLVVGVLKRDAIFEEKLSVINREGHGVYHNDISLSGLKKLVEQITLLYSLIDE